MNAYKAAVCFLLLVGVTVIDFGFLPQSAVLAQSSSEPNAGSETSKPAAEESSDNEKEKRKQGQRKKVFKPSEEISEDSPVPFPVDI